MENKIDAKIQQIKNNVEKQPGFLFDCDNRFVAEALIAESTKYGRAHEGLIRLAFEWGFMEGAESTILSNVKNKKPNGSDVARDILRSLGYTPSTLAIDLGVSLSVARRILRYGQSLWIDDVMRLCDFFEISAYTLTGSFTPGTKKKKQRSSAAKSDRTNIVSIYYNQKELMSNDNISK